MKKSITVIVAIVVILSIFIIPVNAETIYDFSAQENKWAGENAGFDIITYDSGEKAYSAKLYNLGWAGRFGGVAIQGNGLDLAASASKNRYMKMMVKTDELGAGNAFDKLTMIYWYKDDATVNYSPISAAALTVISGNTEYITVVLDLGWTNDTDKVIDKLRMDMFSSSLENAASHTDGTDCGFIYIKYIAFFDTLDAANAYGEEAETETPATEPNAETSDVPGDMIKVLALTALSLNFLYIYSKQAGKEKRRNHV